VARVAQLSVATWIVRLPHASVTLHASDRGALRLDTSDEATLGAGVARQSRLGVTVAVGVVGALFGLSWLAALRGAALSSGHMGLYLAALTALTAPTVDELRGRDIKDGVASHRESQPHERQSEPDAAPG